jgi:hypothetical protein
VSRVTAGTRSGADARGQGRGTGLREEERRREGKEGKRERKKRKGKENRKKGKGREGKKEKGKEKRKEKKKEEGFSKLGEILGKLGGRGKRDFVGFSGFSGVSVIFETTVMARRTVRRDRGMPGIPGEVADSDAGAARGERRWPECGRCRRDSRHTRRGRARGKR